MNCARLWLPGVLALALAACSGPPARTTNLGEVLASRADVLSSTPAGALVLTVVHLRSPAHPADSLPPGRTALEVPEHFRLERPNVARPSLDQSAKAPGWSAKDVRQFDPRPRRSRPDEAEDRPPVFAVLTSNPYVLSATGDVAIGWAGVGSRVWLRSCRHGKPENMDLVVEQDEIGCLGQAWFPGVDTIYLEKAGEGRVVGDPGHEGTTVVIAQRR